MFRYLKLRRQTINKLLLVLAQYSPGSSGLEPHEAFYNFVVSLWLLLFFGVIVLNVPRRNSETDLILERRLCLHRKPSTVCSAFEESPPEKSQAPDCVLACRRCAGKVYDSCCGSNSCLCGPLCGCIRRFLRGFAPRDTGARKGKRSTTAEPLSIYVRLSTGLGVILVLWFAVVICALQASVVC